MALQPSTITDMERRLAELDRTIEAARQRARAAFGEPADPPRSRA